VTEDQPQPPDAQQDEQRSREQEQRPVLRIVKGDATPEEVAALVAVVASLASSAEPPRRRTPEWSAHHRKVRRTLPHGPGGWRSSGLPG
jgi:hypothetical protein